MTQPGEVITETSSIPDRPLTQRVTLRRVAICCLIYVIGPLLLAFLSGLGLLPMQFVGFLNATLFLPIALYCEMKLPFGQAYANAVFGSFTWGAQLGGYHVP